MKSIEIIYCLLGILSYNLFKIVSAKTKFKKLFDLKTYLVNQWASVALSVVAGLSFCGFSDVVMEMLGIELKFPNISSMENFYLATAWLCGFLSITIIELILKFKNGK